MADGFLSTLCVGDEVGVASYMGLSVSKVIKVTSLTITVDGGSVYSRHTGILRGEANYRRHSNFLRPPEDTRRDIAQQKAKDQFSAAKKEASTLLSAMFFDISPDRLKEQCEQVRSLLLDMERISTTGITTPV